MDKFLAPIPNRNDLNGMNSVSIVSINGIPVMDASDRQIGTVRAEFHEPVPVNPFASEPMDIGPDNVDLIVTDLALPRNNEMS